MLIFELLKEERPRNDLVFEVKEIYSYCVCVNTTIMSVVVYTEMSFDNSKRLRMRREI